MSGTVLYPAEFGPPPDEEPIVTGRQDVDPAVLWRVARLLLEAAVQSVSTVDGALTRVPPVRRVAVDVMVGGGAVAYEAAGRVAGRLAGIGRSIAGGVLRLPLADGRSGPARALSRLAERGARERAAAAVDIQQLAAALVPAVTAAVLDRLDLTSVVRERVALNAIVAEVDVDAVVARVDVDAIASQIDLDAIVNRLDLVDLANRVIEGIDLPEIIRESTGSVTGEMVRGVRMQGIEADQAVAGLVARLLRRRPRPAAPGLGAPP